MSNVTPPADKRNAQRNRWRQERREWLANPVNADRNREAARLYYWHRKALRASQYPLWQETLF